MSTVNKKDGFVWYIPGYSGYNLIAILLRVTNKTVIPGTLRDTVLYELEDGLFNNVPEEEIFETRHEAARELLNRCCKVKNLPLTTYHIYIQESGLNKELFPCLIREEWLNLSDLTTNA